MRHDQGSSSTAFAVRPQRSPVRYGRPWMRLYRPEHRNVCVLYPHGFNDIAIEFVERFTGMPPIVNLPRVSPLDLVSERRYDLERVGEYIAKAMRHHDGIIPNSIVHGDDDRLAAAGGSAVAQG